MFQKWDFLVVSVLILEALLDDEPEGVFSLHSFNDTEAAATKIDYLFLWIKLIVIL